MFQIHERLLADTFDLGKFELSFVRLHRCADIPWLILVPQVNVTEIHELDSDLRAQLSFEVDRLSKFVAKEPNVEKINVAAIGNLVPQMHIHVIGRSSNDPHWPGVVWGQDLGPRSYNPEEIADFRHRLGT